MAQVVTAQGGDPNPLDTTGLCLLSLDGGGVRGLSTLLILRGLMGRLNSERKSAGLEAVKPCEVFDLIGGTSTGGIIAIMLGRLEMDVDECINAYTSLMKGVFAKPASRFKISWKLNVQAKFDSMKLKAAIEDQLQKLRIPLEEKFDDGKERGCKTFVCSTSKETAGVTRIRSYALPGETGISATICEAALATSAATGFFDDVSIGARKFVDGALGANNPVDEVEGEAAEIWSNGTGNLKPLVKCFVSIGTGVPGKKAIEDNIGKFLSETLVGIATETQETQRKFIARWAKHYDDNRYFRFNVEQGLQDVGLAEYDQQGRMEAVTEEYLTDQAQKFRLRDCVQNLRQKQSMTDTFFSFRIDEYTKVRIIESQTTGSNVYRTIPFGRNPYFVNRVSYLDLLEEKLFTTSKIAIFGLGGVGKTQIALELAHRTAKKHEDCSIFWLVATNAESIQQGFTEIAKKLKLSSQRDNVGIRGLVRRHLSQESTGKWLLVIDNIDDMDLWTGELRGFVPTSPHGCVVCTTRNRKVALKIAVASDVVEVSKMDPDTAVELLSRSIIDQELLKNRQTTMHLLEQLAFLPLAIVQAGKYISENDDSLDHYLKLLNKQEQQVIDLLGAKFEDDWRYPDIQNAVATTWLISFEQIQRFSPLAAEYLSFMACVDSHNIPRSLLPPALSEKQETDALGTLSAYTFIQKRDGANDSFDVHRLVRLATRNWLRKSRILNVWTMKAATRLQEVLPNDDHDNRNLWKPYLPHVQSVLASENAKQSGFSTTTLEWKFARCLFRDGRYKEAEKLSISVIEARIKEFGRDHENTLVSLESLADIYRFQGFATKSEELELEVIEKRERHLGPLDPLTLQCKYSLALSLGDQGRWNEAKGLHEEIGHAMEEILGKEHHMTLENMSGLAKAYRELGQLKKAEKLGADLVNTYQRLYGDDRPQTLESIANLALTLWEQGKLKEAEELHVKQIRTYTKVFGPEHPSTLIKMGNLSSIYRSLKRWQEAQKLLTQVYDTYMKLYGPDYMDTLTSLDLLGDLLGKQDRFQEALELGTQVVKRSIENFGQEHPATLVSMSKVTGYLVGLKSWDEAEAKGKEVVEISKRVLGIGHPDTLRYMSELALIYDELAMFHKARELQEKALETATRELGLEHRRTLRLMSDLAYTIMKQGNRQEAIFMMLECVQRQQDALGSSHPNTQWSRERLDEWQS